MITVYLEGQDDQRAGALLCEERLRELGVCRKGRLREDHCGLTVFAEVLQAGVRVTFHTV